MTRSPPSPPELSIFLMKCINYFWKIGLYATNKLCGLSIAVLYVIPSATQPESGSTRVWRNRLKTARRNGALSWKKSPESLRIWRFEVQIEVETNEPTDAELSINDERRVRAAIIRWLLSWHSDGRLAFKFMDIIASKAQFPVALEITVSAEYRPRIHNWSFLPASALSFIQKGKKVIDAARIDVYGYDLDASTGTAWS